MPTTDPEDTYALVLLSLVIWREARGEGVNGWKAVGCSIRNRVLRPSWWGKDYISVITKKWQYSAMGAPGDPQLIKYPKTDDARFYEIMSIASDIIEGYLKSPVPGADSYYDDSISAPSWATPDKFIAKVGRLNFYNMDQDYEDA